MLHLFDYLDYRKYFEEWLSLKKSKNPRYSLRLLARQIGCDPSFLVRVLQGKKNLSSSLLLKLSSAINLSKKETEYLELLLQLEKSTTVQEKKYVLEKLTPLRKSQAQSVSALQYEYYEKWYYTVIRELLSIYRFKDNFVELAQSLSPPIRVSEAQKAIQVLESLGFIQKNKLGYYVQSSPSITSGEGWRSIAIANYQIDNLELAKSAFDMYPEEKRNLSTLTLSISKESYHLMCEKLRGLRADFLELEKKDRKASCVYQMNFQIFPVTSEIERAGE